MSHNILYLTYDGLADPLGQSQILPYLEGLAEKGYEITVISFEKGTKLEAGGLKFEAEELKARSQKLRAIQLKYHKSPPVLSTIYDIYLLRKAVIKELHDQKINIIHCRSYLTSLVGLWAKRRYGVKFIFDMRGFWADERVEGGLWNLKNPIFKAVYHFFKKKEKEFLYGANATISLTQNAKEEIIHQLLPNKPAFRSGSQRNNLKTQQNSIWVIPTCADLNLFNPDTIPKEETQQLRDKLGIRPDEFVLLYLGSLGTWYMLEEMLDFFKELKAERLKRKGVCRFLFLTREHEQVKEAIRERNYDAKDFIITSCPREQVPKFISVCDASIFFIIPSYSKKASAATKMGEIMAMGKPVVTNAGWGDVDEIIPKSAAGVLVPEQSVNGYRNAISELCNAPFDALNIRKQAADFFSLEKGIEQYSGIYQSILKTIEDGNEISTNSQ